MMRWSIALLLTIAVPSVASAQARPVSTGGDDVAARIANAVSAAPPFVSAQATVLDWPASDGAKMPVLRQGTNGWTCLPDFPPTEGNDPMCLDRTWLAFVEAQIAKRPPQPTRVGIGYMLAPGGGHGSASDPFATAPTATNHWGHDGPHLMIVSPDPKALEGLPTTRDGGGPYVMFAGTSYAHIMIPTVEPSTTRKN